MPDKDLAAGTRMIGNLAEKPTGTDEFPDCRFCVQRRAVMATTCVAAAVITNAFAVDTSAALDMTD